MNRRNKEKIKKGGKKGISKLLRREAKNLIRDYGCLEEDDIKFTSKRKDKNTVIAKPGRQR